MSFVKEIINIVNENDIADVQSGLRKLTNEIGDFQTETRQHIDQNYSDFKEMIEENNGLLGQANRLAIEVDTLYEKIDTGTKEGIFAMAGDVQQYLNEMEEIRIGVRVNQRLVRIDNLFRQLELLQESNQISNIYDTLDQLKKCIFEHDDHDIFLQLDCYKNLKLRFHTERESFCTLLREMFASMVQMDERSFQSSKCAVIKISTDPKLHQVFYLLLQTSYNAQSLYTFFMRNVFEPILTRPVSFEVKVIKDTQHAAEYNVIEVSFSRKQIGAGERNLRPNYKHVFSHLTKTFNALRPLNIIVPSKKTTFFQQMAERVADEFYSMLISECLEFSIPERIDDLCKSDLAKEVMAFDEFLKSIKFVNDTNASKLHEFKEKIEVIFKKRFCMDILDRAVQIMRKDLHEMQIVEETNPDGGNFPRCMVSRSTFDLINLMQQILKESESITASSVDEYVLADIKQRLRQTIPTILKKYPTEILEAHSKLLQTIPQQAALFHNNCAYLAWWFSRCDIDGETDSADYKREETNGRLLEFGTNQFATQITNQRTQLVELLREIELSDTIEFSPQPLKIVRQCIRQMELLKNVWQTILPELVYNKTMGVIVNHFCDEIIKKVMSCEDISSETSNGLVNICETIIERLPAVFTDPLMVSVHTRNWLKLQQIKTVLNASLADIVELWADGKGPLTLNFRAEDIRQLIRAIFQNTDRRAEALVKIL